MTEPTVPVPVSLIEEAADLIESDRGSISTARRLRALLSQPTPTAEPPATYQQGYDDGYMAGEYDAHNAKTLSAPPSIDTMAPGTTFTEEVRWTVTGTLSTGVVVAHSKDGMRFADRFDPSTIRDVTPPKEDDRG